jgi:hypothetical protein
LSPPKSTFRETLARSSELSDFRRVLSQLEERYAAFHRGDSVYVEVGLAIKNPPKETHLKKPTKIGFFGFFFGVFKIFF